MKRIEIKKMENETKINVIFNYFIDKSFKSHLSWCKAIHSQINFVQLHRKYNLNENKYTIAIEKIIFRFICIIIIH